MNVKSKLSPLPNTYLELELDNDDDDKNAGESAEETGKLVAVVLITERDMVDK